MFKTEPDFYYPDTRYPRSFEAQNPNCSRINEVASAGLNWHPIAPTCSYSGIECYEDGHVSRM